MRGRAAAHKNIGGFTNEFNNWRNHFYDFFLGGNYCIKRILLLQDFQKA
ncbi:hypothetical protein B0H50_106111 [Hallerella porci]|uniref:Uncharacterized protein n=1 Tax=Hallerella porci TaxID=1945871 RepID=A0ABX5LMR7_9BACT|nr:hypothetical protein B0H50_106111 [Hallerella porci]